MSQAPTHVSVPVRPSLGPQYFQISILLASLVALFEKLKKVDPNYLSILGLGRIFWNWWGGAPGGEGSRSKKK